MFETGLRCVGGADVVIGKVWYYLWVFCQDWVVLD